MKELDEELLYEELMYGTASVRRNIQNDFMLITINPHPNLIKTPYFKVYDADNWRKATKVARLTFFEPKWIGHTGGHIPPWIILTEQDIQNIEDYFKSPSRDTPGAKVWDVLKYRWNDEYGFYMRSFADYIRGEYDEEYKDDPSYVPSYLDPPDYRKLAR